ncbi:hypothetical protein ACF8EA_24970 [Pseudomonas sp. YQ_5]|uniref:hypothetical protein n=1 Tax=Pseudomonas sp. YQ_5 TaxID=3367229 RepID=UPI00370AC59C
MKLPSLSISLAYKWRAGHSAHPVAWVRSVLPVNMLKVAIGYQVSNPHALECCWKGAALSVLSSSNLQQTDQSRLGALRSSQMETIKVEMVRHAPCEHCRIAALYLKEIQC